MQDRIVTPTSARVYVWQMNTGYWFISAINDVAAIATGLLLWRAGLDRAFNTREEASAALKAWRGYGA